MSDNTKKPSVSGKPVVCVALYSFDVGGSEKVGSSLIKHYVDCGLDVVCVSTRRMTGPLRKPIEECGVECLALGLDRYSRLARRFKRRRLIAWLEDRNVSVVHAHHFSVFGDIAGAAEAAGVSRTIVSEHSVNAVLKSWRFRKRVRGLARKATVCTAINGFVQETLCDVTGLPATRVPVIENGVDTDLFAPVEKPPPMDAVTVGWVGRLHPDKDLLNGLRAFELATRQTRGALRLLIAGDGEEMALGREFVQAANLEESVEFLGSVSDVVAVLHRCDFLVVSSRTEGTPLALLEALSCGLPVVATAVGGIPESVTPESAKLVPAQDRTALAEAIISLSEQPELRRQMGAAARHLALQRFSDRAMKDKYVQVLLGAEA